MTLFTMFMNLKNDDLLFRTRMLYTDGETVSCLPSTPLSISKRRGFDSRSV